MVKASAAPALVSSAFEITQKDILQLLPQQKPANMPAMTMSRQAVRPVAQVQKPKVQAPKPQKVRVRLG